MRSSEFMASLPQAVQRQLGAEIPLQRGRLWPWGVQLYVDDPRYHYEVSRAPLRLGDEAFLQLIAGRTARLIGVLHPLYMAISRQIKMT